MILPAFTLPRYAYTIEMWVMPKSTPTEKTTLFSFEYEAPEGSDESATQQVYKMNLLAKGVRGGPSFEFTSHEQGGYIGNRLRSNPCPTHKYVVAHCHCAIGQNASLYINGELCGSMIANFSPAGVYFNKNAIGRGNEHIGVGADVVFDEVRIWRIARDAQDIKETRYCKHLDKILTNATAQDLFAYYACDSYATEMVSSWGEIDPAYLVSCDFVTGAPAELGGLIDLADTPSIYRQNNPSLPGYNPNEEQAFVYQESEGAAIYALQQGFDKADYRASPNYTLVNAVAHDTNQPYMLAYQVCNTNETFKTFEYDTTAGTRIPSPNQMLSFAAPTVKALSIA